MPSDAFSALFAARPVLLAPMEDVSDAIFRRICRRLGADACFTEFVNVESLLKGCTRSERKLRLDEDDRPTAIQIYGADPARLVEAARIAEAAGPAFIDINCGCWVPRIARRGAGAGWLRDPDAMVAMAEQVVRAVSLPEVHDLALKRDVMRAFPTAAPGGVSFYVRLGLVTGPDPEQFAAVGDRVAVFAIHPA